jgi:hypothetical protein
MRASFGLLIALSLAVPARGAELGKQTRTAVKWPECYCTDSQGKRVDLEEEICLTVDGRTFLARCGMSLNNPIWRKVKDGCEPKPLSLLERLYRSEPVLDACLVDPHVPIAEPRAGEDRQG